MVVDAAQSLRIAGCDLMAVTQSGRKPDHPDDISDFLLADRIRHDADLPTMVVRHVMSMELANCAVLAGYTDLCGIADGSR